MGTITSNIYSQHVVRRQRQFRACLALHYALTCDQLFYLLNCPPWQPRPLSQTRLTTPFNCHTLFIFSRLSSSMHRHSLANGNRASASTVPITVTCVRALFYVSPSCCLILPTCLSVCLCACLSHARRQIFAAFLPCAVIAGSSTKEH